MAFDRAEYWRNYRKKNAGKWKLKPVSKNRAEALKRYRKAREKHFEKYPTCQFPGCESKEVTLHHGKGRIGCHLTDKRFFKSLCLEHHRWVETHPKEAIRMGLSFKRLDS